MMKTYSMLSALLFLSGISGVAAQGTKIEPFPIIARADDGTLCDEIIDTHEISGTCCSMRNINGRCVLTVVAGTCRAQGPVFKLNFQSSDTTSDCPDSEFSLTDPPSNEPTSSPSLSPAPTTFAESSSNQCQLSTLTFAILFAVISFTL